MHLHKDNPSRLLQMREAAFESATIAIKDAKMRHAAARQHRAISRITIEPALWLQAVLIVIICCCAILVAETRLMEFWRDCIVFLFRQMDIPLMAQHHASTISALRFEWSPDANQSYMPNFAMKLGSAVITFVIFASTTKMGGNKLPLQYLLRILCAVHTIALIFFWYVPSQFPYTIPDHIRDLVNMGYMLVLAIPVLLGIGYYLLHLKLVIKLFHTILILVYFILMIPVKIVLHTLILYHFSLLYMPLLYICFGAVFDVLIFIALYSWAISALPEQVTQ